MRAGLAPATSSPQVDAWVARVGAAVAGDGRGYDWADPVAGRGAADAPAAVASRDASCRQYP